MNGFEKDLEAFVNQIPDQVGHDGSKVGHDGDSGPAPGMTKRVVALKFGTVIMEVKDGPYEPTGREDILE